ncbi:MAG TPA: aminotransferase class IV [Tepidisphaeraceae bacterium]|jgi:branched-subunit amino acid aminotransferase/4-amino-4-deoxychorismate lyase
MPSAWLDGRLIDESEARISIRDTGLLHAAGVFTTMRAYNGRIFRIEQHLARLRTSSEALFVPLVHKDETLVEAAGELLERDGLRDARLRITVTRGSARQDPLHGLHLAPSTFITAAPLETYPQEFYQRGMTVIVLDEQKLNPYDLQAGHKTLNYFSRLGALKTANERGAGEALWFNVHNYVQSGSITNVFVMKGGALITPPTPEDLQDPTVREATAYPRSAVLPGITRGTVIELAQAEGIEVRRRSIAINELLEADEMFLTNSIMQVMPVCRIERQAIGNDKPGRITLKMLEAYRRAVDAG